MTIKGRGARRVFPSKNALQSKSLDLYSPGEFVGRSSETQRKMRKQWILSDAANGPIQSQNQPRNEKTDQKTGRRRIFKMVEHFFIFQKNSLNLKTANFSNPSRWAIFTISKNSPGETGTSFCLKKEFEHRENGRKEIRTSDLYSWPVIRKNQTGRLS